MERAYGCEHKHEKPYNFSIRIYYYKEGMYWVKFISGVPKELHILGKIKRPYKKHKINMKVCAVCGSEFVAKSNASKYCDGCR